MWVPVQGCHHLRITIANKPCDQVTSNGNDYQYLYQCQEHQSNYRICFTMIKITLPSETCWKGRHSLSSWRSQPWRLCPATLLCQMSRWNSQTSKVLPNIAQSSAGIMSTTLSNMSQAVDKKLFTPQGSFQIWAWCWSCRSHGQGLAYDHHFVRLQHW